MDFPKVGSEVDFFVGVRQLNPFLNLSSEMLVDALSIGDLAINALT